MIRLPTLTLRRAKRGPKPRRRRYASGDVGDESANLLTFVALFGVMAGIGGYLMGVPALHQGLPHVDSASLQTILPMLKEILH